jgi:hypothetical protein
MFAMKLHKQAFGALAAAVTLAVQCYSQAQVPAPASLPPCLIQYSTLKPLIHLSASRLMLYNADQTYVEINSISNGGSIPTSTGTFTYVVDQQNPAHATIVYNGRGGSLANDELYFETANFGLEGPPNQATPAGDSFPAFTLYPRQATNGACNVSNLCQLATGSTGTCGFVVQSGGPRWVLLRAIGASLRNFGVSPTVSSPSFTLYDSTQTVQGTSSVWSSDPNLVGGYQTIFSLVGAFPLNIGSDEGVFLVPLNPGAYTAQFKAGSAGTILFEAYILPF